MYTYITKTIATMTLVCLLMVAQTPAAHANTHASMAASLAAIASMLDTIQASLDTRGEVLAASVVSVSSKQELAAAISQATVGQTIQLAPGTYGSILIDGQSGNVGGSAFSGAPLLTGAVTIESQDANNPAVVHKITVRGGSGYWHFNNLFIDGAAARNSQYDKMVSLSAPNLTFENSTIDFGDFTNWDANDWVNNTADAIYVNARNVLVKNNYVRGSRITFNFYPGSAGSRLVNNTADGIAADGVRVNDGDLVIEKNLLKNFVGIDGNHDDCLQGFGRNSAGQTDQDVILADVVVRDNICIAREDPNQTLKSYGPQGFGAFDSSMQNWIVENNVAVVDTYHGISLSGAINNTIRNNTVIDMDTAVSPANSVWITVGGNKTGSYGASGNTITGNIANTFKAQSAPQVTTFSNNQTVQQANYDQYFVDWWNGDVRLKSSSPIQGVGADLDPATVGSDHTVTSPSTPPPAPTDSDNDGVADTSDNCPQTVNTDQADFDNDGTGDACDDDDDNDGILDTEEQSGCQFDSDTSCGVTTPTDSDNDGVADTADNCPNTANANQTDTDNDGTGDACDSTPDGDPTDPEEPTEPDDPTDPEEPEEPEEPTTPEEPTEPEDSEESHDEARIRTTDTLNVRAVPAGSIIATVPMGSVGVVLSGDGVLGQGYFWIKVRFEGDVEGYVAKRYTESIEATDGNEETTTRDGAALSAERRTEILAQIEVLLAAIALLQAQLNEAQ